MPESLEIHEACDGEWTRLRLTGELDLGSAPVLTHRLAELRAEKRPVRLDLSGLEFMDSSGIHVLIVAFKEARANGWHFAVDPTLSPQVEQLFKLTNLRPLIQPPGDEQAVGRAAQPTETGTNADRL